MACVVFGYRAQKTNGIIRLLACLLACLLAKIVAQISILFKPFRVEVEKLPVLF